MPMPRYKLGIKVVMGEIKGQGVKVASKCLWDVVFDNYASYHYTNVNTFHKLFRKNFIVLPLFTGVTMNEAYIFMF